MIELSVPERHRSMLELLAELGDTEFASIQAAFEAEASFQPVSVLRDLAAASLPESDRTKSLALVSALLSMSGRLRNVETSDIAEAVANAIDLNLDAAARGRLQQRLEALLSTRALSSTGDALELQVHPDFNYSAARVLSDIRPVFTGPVTEPPEGAVIVETLQIHTWSRDGRTQTLNVAMDEADIRELREVLERALKKTTTLHKLLERQEIVHFRLDERDA